MAASCGLASVLGDLAMGRHISMLAAALESIEGRSELLTVQLARTQSDLASCKTKLADSEESLAAMAARLDASNTEQQAQKREISRLTALLEASKLHAALSSEQLMADLADERMRSERLRAVRDDALLQRDEALVELQNAYTDVETMHATLADSALYVRQLRRRIAELEVMFQQRHQQQQQQYHQTLKQGPGGDGQQDKDQEGVFSLASIKASIATAVAAAAAEPEAERKRRIRQLQLRWHPDKNPVLREFATEVTKIINEAVAQLENTQ